MKDKDPMGVLTAELSEWPVCWLARAAKLDWPAASNGGTASLLHMDAHPAYPYLSAMLSIDELGDAYGADDGYVLARYFLSNARAWRGPIAKAIKAELRRRLDG